MNRQVLVSVAAVFFLLLSPLAPAFAYDAGNALDFDGVDDCAASGGFSTSMTNITLEAWVYHRTVPASIQRYVYLQGSGGNDVAVIRHDGVAQQGRLHFYISTSGTYRHIRVDGALQTGKWYHVAGTWDGTTQRLYLDGEDVGTNTPGGSLDAPDGFVILSDNIETMDGYLDEVRIWNDARTPDEIRSNMFGSLSGSESGLEGYWKLNQTSGSIAYDSAGSVDLNLGGSMTDDDWVTSGAFSGPRNALDFDGTDDYVSIPSNTSLDNSQFSTEFWVKMDDPGEWDGIIDKGRNTNSDWYFLTRTSALGEGVVFSIRTASSLATLPYSWSDASWHHVAGTYDGTNMILYVDGVQRGSCTASMIVTTNSIRIGSRRNGTYHSEGKLDEVRIWNDVRTASEIQEHMCKTMEGDESNLVAYWRFDQAAGTTLYDLTSNGNNGTLTNMTDDDWVASEAFTTWIGCVGTDWATAANWSIETVPNSTSTNVGIPIYSGGNEPTMAGDYICNHLSITSGATYTINSGWTLTLNGNAFSSGTQAGDGEVDLTGASAAHGLSGVFSNVELNEANGVELAGDATINGTLTLTGGTFTVGANTLTLKNAITGTAVNLSAGNTSSITIAGNGTGVNIPGSVTELNNVTLNNTNGTALQNSLELDGTLTLTDGAFTVGANTLMLKNAITGTAVNLSAGNTSSITIAGSGTGVNIPGSVTELNNVTLNNTNGTALQNSLELDGTLTLTDGAFTVGANTLTLKNAIAGTATNLSAGNTSSITIAGTGTGIDIPSSVTELNNVTLDNTNGTALQNSLELDGTLTLTSGTFTVGANTLTLKNAIAGTAVNLSAGNTSSITIAGSGTGVNIPGSVTELNNVTLDNANGATLQNDLMLEGTLTLTNGAFAIGANTLTLKNAIGGTDTDLSANSTSSIAIAGSGIGVNIPGSVTELNNVSVDNANGTVLQNDLMLDGTLSLIDGALTSNGHTLSYGSTGTLKYNGTSSQTTSDAEFPASNGPFNLTIDNPNDTT